ncbi:hypothetical protein VNO77_18269 [Canavalia gladiata]|uniref:Uncharacterized protein n=1 Tax=Canavalia gladiata TaxID=3824 RepID=A0AAN9QJG9_CANGL
MEILINKIYEYSEYDLSCHEVRVILKNRRRVEGTKDLKRGRVGNSATGYNRKFRPCFPRDAVVLSSNVERERERIGPVGHITTRVGPCHLSDLSATYTDPCSILNEIKL